MGSTESSNWTDFVLLAISWVVWVLWVLLLPLILLGTLVVFLLVCVWQHTGHRVVVALWLRGDVAEAWKRCLPLWERDGSISDRRDKALPEYSPSFRTC